MDSPDDLFPVRILSKRFPVEISLFAVGVVDQVDQRVLLVRLIEGGPITEVFDSMLVEKARGVFAEAGVEGACNLPGFVA